MSLKRWTIPAVLVFAVASCGDAGDGPLSPTLDGRSESSSAVALQPIIANGCNAYEGACDDDDDAPVGGGVGSPPVPGGDWGGGGGSTTDPAMTTSDPAPLEDDMVEDTVPPNCDNPIAKSEKAYCASSAPTGERHTRTSDALKRIESRGGECANIAAVGFSLLAGQRIRYYPTDPNLAGGYGGSNIGALLDGRWVDEFYNRRDGTGRNLDHALVHEIEHVMGRHHTNGQFEGPTPNDSACDG